MGYQIKIKNLKVKVRIGIHSFEKIVSQTLLISLKLDTKNKNSQSDLQFSSESKIDKQEISIDYEQIIELVQQIVAKKTFILLEDLADEVIMQLQSNFQLQKGKIQLYKTAIFKNADKVGISKKWKNN